VGRTIRSLKERLSAHFSSAINEPKGLLHEAINRYGKENFTIELLYTGSNPLMEDTFISQYGCEYNTRKSGVIPTEEWRAKCKSGRSGFTLSQEHKDKIGKSQPMYGKKYTIEERKELSTRLTGIKKGPQSPEHKAKLSASIKATLAKKYIQLSPTEKKEKNKKYQRQWYLENKVTIRRKRLERAEKMREAN